MRILPYIEEANIFNSLNQKYGFNQYSATVTSPQYQNAQLSKTIISTYQCPSASTAEIDPVLQPVPTAAQRRRRERLCECRHARKNRPEQLQTHAVEGFGLHVPRIPTSSSPTSRTAPAKRCCSPSEFSFPSYDTSFSSYPQPTESGISWAGGNDVTTYYGINNVTGTCTSTAGPGNAPRDRAYSAATRAGPTSRSPMPTCPS